MLLKSVKKFQSAKGKQKFFTNLRFKSQNVFNDYSSACMKLTR